MTSVTRRHLPFAWGGAALSTSFARTTHAAAADARLDLLIKGGEALDPIQKLRAVRYIGIRNGVIEVVQADIPADRARFRKVNGPWRGRDGERRLRRYTNGNMRPEGDSLPFVQSQIA